MKSPQVLFVAVSMVGVVGRTRDKRNRENRR